MGSFGRTFYFYLLVRGDSNRKFPRTLFCSFAAKDGVLVIFLVELFGVVVLFRHGFLFRVVIVASDEAGRDVLVVRRLVVEEVDE